MDKKYNNSSFVPFLVWGPSAKFLALLYKSDTVCNNLAWRSNDLGFVSFAMVYTSNWPWISQSVLQYSKWSGNKSKGNSFSGIFEAASSFITSNVYIAYLKYLLASRWPLLSVAVFEYMLAKL